jgi:succinoglycan biosynthesis transport protein ExoP
LGCLIGLAAAATYVLSVPVLYKSTAQVLIDRSVNRFFQANKILDEPAFDDAETASQIYVLSSESIILPIVRSMDLVHDAEFVGDIHDRGTQSQWGIRKLIKIATQFAGWEDEPQVEPEVALERIAVATFLKRLTVDREGIAGVINVTFASADSKKAALIANTIVDSYLAATSDAKARSTKIASGLLQDRLIELKQSVSDANKALQEFKIANNLIGKGEGLQPAEQIAPLTGQLTSARVQLAEAKTRLDYVQEQMSSQDASGTIFPDNQIILGLRSKYLDLSSRAAELASRVGSDHFAVVKLRKEIDETRAAIRDEEKRLAGVYVSAYQTARSQSNELAAIKTQLSDEAKTESQAHIAMRELESKADSLRDQYNSALEKFNTLSIQPFNPIQDVRIVTRAAPQLYKSSRKSLAILGGGVLLGLLFGVGGAIARELAAGVFWTPEQVKQATGIYCVGVPIVEASTKQVVSLRAVTNSMLLEEFVLEAPHSRFAESFRNIKVLIDAAQRARGDKVIGVVSPVAKNGKSTIVTNLGSLMAASGRTLVIDADLHRRQLTARLEPDACEGLIEALDDPSRLAALVLPRPRSGLDFLPCVLPKRIPNAAELLGSPQMERLLIEARESYNYIIVECAPIMSVVDVKTIERFVDRFVFVIEWGRTTRRVAEEVLDECDIKRERALCFVLNKVDPSALRTIESYKGSQYVAYYET